MSEPCGFNNFGFHNFEYLQYFSELLNAEYEKGGWWQKLVDRLGIFLSLEGKNICAFWRGAFVVRVQLVDNRLVVQANKWALVENFTRTRVILKEESTAAHVHFVQGLKGFERRLPQICALAEQFASPEKRLASRIGRRFLGLVGFDFSLGKNSLDLVLLQKDASLLGICIRSYLSGDLRGSSPRIISVLSKMQTKWQEKQSEICKQVCRQIFLWRLLKGKFFQARLNFSTPQNCVPKLSLLITEFDSVQRQYGLSRLLLPLGEFEPICVAKPDNVNEKHLAYFSSNSSRQ